MNGGGFTLAGSGWLVRRPLVAYPSGGYVGPLALRRFLETVGEWSARLPSCPPPVAIWTYQDAASPIVDKLGAKNLVENQALLYAQAGDPEPPIAPRSSVALDTADANEWAGAADAAHADIGAGASRSLLVRCRIPDVSTIVPIMGCGTSNTLPHWGIQTDTSGRLVAKARDGAGTPVVLNPNTVAAYDDGAYHDVVWSLDRAGALLHITTEAEDVTVAVGALGAIDASTGLRFGASMARVPVVGIRASFAAMFDAHFSPEHLAAFRQAIP